MRWGNFKTGIDRK